jgi:hypothetical protein
MLTSRTSIERFPTIVNDPFDTFDEKIANPGQNIQPDIDLAGDESQAVDHGDIYGAINAARLDSIGVQTSRIIDRTTLWQIG